MATLGGTFGGGTVFKIERSTGEGTTVHSFGDMPDGHGPRGDLILDSAGNLYGTTVEGGMFGYGAVFKIDPNGVETVLHSFTRGSDGWDPSGGLAIDEDGNLYGTTPGGGTGGGGTVLKLDPAGTFTVVHSS